MFTSREVVFVESITDGDVSCILNGLATADPDLPAPQSGGIIEDGTLLVSKSGKRFWGVSYRGDLRGWRDLLAAYCKKANLKWGIVKGKHLQMSDGHVLPIDECTIIED
jgi:hypothetical protein